MTTWRVVEVFLGLRGGRGLGVDLGVRQSPSPCPLGGRLGVPHRFRYERRKEGTEERGDHGNNAHLPVGTWLRRQPMLLPAHHPAPPPAPQLTVYMSALFTD